MKIEQAIKLLHPDTTAEEIAEIEYKHGFRGKQVAINKINKACVIACKAMEKQIPKKPVIKYGEKPITHNYGRLMSFHCPNCGKFIVAMYETDVENGGGLHKDLKGCSTCLQAIDFVGYYKIDKLDDDIDWR